MVEIFNTQLQLNTASNINKTTQHRLAFYRIKIVIVMTDFQGEISSIVTK
jgi:hypothetical protein